MTAKIKNTLQKNSENEIEELRLRLAEAEETLNAIRGGEIDSIMVSTPEGERVFSISSAETPYRIFIEKMNEGAAILSEEGTILYSNKQLANLFSIPIEKVVGTNFSEYISSKDGDNFESLLEAGLKDKSIGEVSYVDPKGVLHNFSISLSSFPSLGKNEVCMIITDVTELKKNEEDLNNSRLAAIESEQRYKKLFDDDLTGNFIATVDGEILLCNITFAKIFGFESVDELVNKNITSFYKDPSSRDEFIKQLCEQKRIEQFEREFINRNGKIISVIENVVGEFNQSGELILTQGYIFDNTERKRAEAALRISEIKYRGLYDSIRDAILVANTDRKIVECNQAFTDLFGYSLSEIKNKETITIYENEQQFNELGRALKKHSENTDPFLYTVNYKKKNRVVFPGETSIYYLKNGDRNVKGFIGLIRDISERKQAEEKIRNLAKFPSQDPFPVLRVAKNGALLYINESGLEQLSEWNLQIEHLVPKMVMDAVSNTLNNGKPQEFEFDLSGRTISFYITPITGTEYINLYGWDITDRRLLEQEKDILTINLNERVKELTCLFTISSILEAADISIDVMLNQIVKAIPPGWQYPEICCARIVLDKNEYQTSNYKETSWKMSTDIKVNNEKKGAVEVFYLEEKEEIDEGPFLKEEKDLLNVIAERIGQIIDRKKLESDLYAAAEIARLGYWEYEVDSGNFIFNDQYFRVIHASSSEKQGGNIMSAEEFAGRLVYPADISLVKQNLQVAISSMDPEYIGKEEARVLREDGTVADVSIQYKVLKDSSGRIYKVYGVNQDITERKLVELELIEAKEKAEVSDKIKSEFLAQMSHEIRTPVHVVTSFTSLLKDELTPTQVEENEDILQGIDSASKRIIRTVDLILNMSELQLGSYEPILKEINLNNAIENLIREYSGMAVEKKLQLKFNINNHIYKIIGDEYSVNQIFANLIDNAIKYTSTGKIELSTTKSSTDHLIVSVQDTGIGISEEYLENIFEPFSQEESGYSRGYEGNGLGLALVKKYCDINKAEISVESKKGIGSKFSVSFKV